MNIEKTISQLPTDLNGLRIREQNAERFLERNPENKDALQLLVEIGSKLANTRAASRMKVGSLWWEPHDHYTPEFFAFESPESSNPVASIFKGSTHTVVKKDVYVVRVGGREVLKKFSEVHLARLAGSEAWLQQRSTADIPA